MEKCTCGKDAIAAIRMLVNVGGADLVTKETLTLKTDEETAMCHDCYMQMCAGAIASYFGVGRYISTVK